MHSLWSFYNRWADPKALIQMGTGTEGEANGVQSNSINPNGLGSALKVASICYGRNESKGSA